MLKYLIDNRQSKLSSFRFFKFEKVIDQHVICGVLKYLDASNWRGCIRYYSTPYSSWINNVFQSRSASAAKFTAILIQHSNLFNMVNEESQLCLLLEWWTSNLEYTCKQLNKNEPLKRLCTKHGARLRTSDRTKSGQLILRTLISIIPTFLAQ